MIRRLYHNARKSSNPISFGIPSELKLFLYYYLAEAIYFIDDPNAPLAIVLAIKWGYMGLCDNMRARERFVRS